MNVPLVHARVCHKAVAQLRVHLRPAVVDGVVVRAFHGSVRAVGKFFTQIRQLRFVLVKACLRQLVFQPVACRLPRLLPGNRRRVRPELPEALQLQIRPFVCQRRVFRLCGAAAEPAACRLPRLLPGNCRRVRPELPEALQLQIRPFVCQRRIFRLCGAAVKPAANRLPRLLPDDRRRVRPELPEALQLQVRTFVCQCRVCGRLFARGRSGFAALRLDQLHQIGRLRPAKSAGSRIFPRRARFFVAFFHTFLHLFPPFQAAFRRSRAAVIMPVQSDTPAAAPRFYRGSHIARSCR